MKILIPTLSCLFENSVKIIVAWSSYFVVTTRFETAIVSLIIICFLSLSRDFKKCALLSVIQHIKNDENEEEDFNAASKQLGPIIIINSLFNFGIGIYAFFRLTYA